MPTILTRNWSIFTPHENPKG